jgi:hypothetical protein
MMPIGALQSVSAPSAVVISCDVPSAGGRLSPFRRAALHARDLRILRLAQHKLGGASADFAEALRALQEATREVIPAGRVYLLGQTRFGPIVGSLVSGVGIVETAGGARVIRVARDGTRTDLGGLAP